MKLTRDTDLISLGQVPFADPLAALHKRFLSDTMTSEAAPFSKRQNLNHALQPLKSQLCLDVFRYLKEKIIKKKLHT